MFHMLKHITTDYDNTTFDSGRTIALMVVISTIVFQGWDVLHGGQKFDPQAFGMGIAALLGGLGAYIYGDNAKRPSTDVLPPVDPTAPLEGDPNAPLTQR